MGFLGKFGRRDRKRSRAERAQSQLERHIADLEQRFGELRAACRADRAAYDELLRRAAETDRASFDGEMLGWELRRCREGMARRRSLLDQVCRTLETDRAALDALTGSRLLAALRRTMPDPAEVAALLDRCAQEAEDLRVWQETVARAARESGGRVFLLPADCRAFPDTDCMVSMAPSDGAVAGFIAPSAVCAEERGSES